MSYYMVHVALSKAQQKELIQHISSMTPYHVILSPNQIDNARGEAILVTKTQLQKLMTAKHQKKGIKLTLSRNQLKKMYDGMMAGHGILDSIGSFFKSIPSKASSAFNYIKNKASTGNLGRAYRTVKNTINPPPIMPPDNDTIWHLPEQQPNPVKQQPTKIVPTQKINFDAWKQQKLRYKPNGFFDESHF